MEHGEPLWVPDLKADQRFVTDALLEDGLQSAYAFPIRYRGVCVGIVKMLSRHQRERDPSVVELMDAVGGHLGELLHASAQATERQQLVEELLEARRHNEFLLLATQVLSEVVDYREMVERLARVSVPVMADLCLIDIEDEDGQMRRMAAWHADPDKRALSKELRASYPPDPAGVHPTMEVMRSGRSMWSADMDDEFLRSTSRDERHYAILKMLEFTSYVTVPLRLRNEQVLGTVTLVSAGSGRRFSEKDLGLAEQLAEQVSSVVIRARAYDRERRISHELQRHLLPDAIPPIVGWDVAARYRPAAVGVEVGGDWYDVVPIGEDLVALVVGDVEGHDLGAARIMSRLRHTLGLLLLEERAPGKALQRLNRVSLAGVDGRLATALVGVLNSRTGSVTFSSAGHPSPVRVESGLAVELPVPPGPPLGVQHCEYKDHAFQLDQGMPGDVHRRPGGTAGQPPRRAPRPARIVAARLPQQRAEPGGGLRDRRHDLGRTEVRRHRRAQRPAADRRPRHHVSRPVPGPAAGRRFPIVTACKGRKPWRRSSAPTCRFPASTVSNAPTATSTAPPRLPRCSRSPTGSTTSCPGTPASIAAPATSHDAPRRPTRRRARACTASRDVPPAVTTWWSWCATPPRPSISWPTAWS